MKEGENNMPGAYRVEYRAGKTSPAQYLKSDQKSVGNVGYAWGTPGAATNAMKQFKAFLGYKRLPCASLQVVSDKNEVISKAEIKTKSAKAESAPDAQPSEEPERADIEESAELNGDDSADEIEALAEATEENTSASDTAQEDAVSQDSGEAFNSIISASSAWSQVMVHLDEYQRMFAVQLSKEDRRTQDLLHFIELNELSEAQSAAVIRHLAASRQHRREAKDALLMLEALEPARFAAQSVAHLLDQMDKRCYQPRVEKNLRALIDSECADAPESGDQHSAEAESAEPNCAREAVRAGALPQRAQAVPRINNTAVKCSPMRKTMAEIVAERNAEQRSKHSSELGNDDTSDGISTEQMSRADKRAIDVYIDHQSGMTGRALAKHYGVSPATISRDIARGRELVNAQLSVNGIEEDDYLTCECETKDDLAKAVNQASNKLLAKWADEHSAK